MTSQSSEVLDHLLRENGLAWMVNMYEPKDQAIADYLKLLARVAGEYEKLIGVKVDFSPEALRDESERNPHKVQAFLQVLRPTRAPAMLVMVWRVLQGLRIRELTMDYRELDSFQLRVALSRSGDNGAPDEVENYESKDINDAALVRHLGVAKVEDRPLFDGFYALQLT